MSRRQNSMISRTNPTSTMGHTSAKIMSAIYTSRSLRPSQQNNIEPEKACSVCCHVEFDTYCMMCGLLYCKPCSQREHASDILQHHKLIPSQGREAYKQKAKTIGSPEYEEMKDLDRKIREQQIEKERDMEEMLSLSHQSEGTDDCDIGYMYSDVEKMLLLDHYPANPTIYLCYCNSDRAFAERLYNALTELNYIVWVDWKQPKVGDDWTAPILSGIMTCDVFIPCITPNFTKSQISNFEVDHARTCSKLILPVMASDVPLDSLRPDLATLEFVYFTETNDEEKDSFDNAIRIISKDLQTCFEHAQIHTWLLFSAMTWRRDRYDPECLLERPSEELKLAEAWLYRSALGAQPRPTRWMLGYITSSLNLHSRVHLMSEEDDLALEARRVAKLDRDKASIYLCFGKKNDADQAFAERLAGVLRTGNRKVYIDYDSFDMHDPAFREQQELAYSAIDCHDVVLFIMSDHSISNEQCNWELDHALSLSKRVVPVVPAEIKELEGLRGDIASMEFVFFNKGPDDFNAALETLTDRIDLFLPHLRLHTDLCQKAVKWDRAERKKYMLGGKSLRKALDWLLDSALGKVPRPSQLHLDYILAAKEQRRCTIL